MSVPRLVFSILAVVNSPSPALVHSTPSEAATPAARERTVTESATINAE